MEVIELTEDLKNRWKLCRHLHCQQRVFNEKVLPKMVVYWENQQHFLLYLYKECPFMVQNVRNLTLLSFIPALDTKPWCWLRLHVVLLQASSQPQWYQQALPCCRPVLPLLTFHLFAFFISPDSCQYTPRKVCSTELGAWELGRSLQPSVSCYFLTEFGCSHLPLAKEFKNGMLADPGDFTRRWCLPFSIIAGDC